jgi:mono/diheme cytochrome c family protein
MKQGCFFGKSMKYVAVAAAAVLAIAGCSTEAELADQEPEADTSEEAISAATPILSPPIEHFKYGSIGADKMGVPLAIFKAIPIVCADRLPAGTNPRKEPLASFGFIYEPGHELPIGFSTRRAPIVGTELVGNNCSVCHTSTVRAEPNAPRSVYFGAPATRLDLETYQNFLFECISDPSRFNTTSLNRAFDELGVWGFDRILAFKSSFMRAFLQDTKTKVESVVRDGPWGPGRDDAIGLSGAMLLGREYVPSIAAPVDFPAVWNQKTRAGHALHWDGAAGTAFERNVLVALGAGTPRDGIPFESLNAVQSFLDTLPAPKYPFAIDATLAAKGATIFQERCNDCHGATGSRTFKVTDIAELRTDPNRIDSVSQPAIDKMNSLSGRGWAFDGFKKTNGYLNSPLDGIWLRAPYLHNGSVPTLRDLLKPPASRPKTFYRGNDVYDAKNVGFVSTVASEGSTRYSFFDTARAGNGNDGHFGPAYGSDLSDAQIDALLEYMKTL